MPTYGGDVANDETDGFLRALPPQTRAIAQRLIAAVCEQADMDVAVKWRQLTFAVEGDFDYWICAVAPTKKGVNLTFHFGRLLRDDGGLFNASDAKFVRKIGYESVEDVDGAAISDLVSKAIAALPAFRRVVREKG
jgi:hypothetical protein